MAQIGELPGGGLTIGALARNSDTANHALLRQRHLLLSEALLSGASPPLLNMATTGGNLMQRTCCALSRRATPYVGWSIVGTAFAAFYSGRREHLSLQEIMMNTLQKIMAVGAASLAAIAVNPVLAAGAAGGASAGGSAGATAGGSAGATAGGSGAATGGRARGEAAGGAGTSSGAPSVPPVTSNGAAGGANTGINGSTTANGASASSGVNRNGDTMRSNGSVTGSVDLSAGVPATTSSQQLQLTGSGSNALLPAVPTLPGGNANATVTPNGSITGTTAGASTTLPNGNVVVGSNGGTVADGAVATTRPNGTAPGAVDLTTTTDVPGTTTPTTGAQ